MESNSLWCRFRREPENNSIIKPLLKPCKAHCLFGLRLIVSSILFCSLNVSAAEPNEVLAPQQVQLPVFKMWLGAGLPDMEAYNQAIVMVMLEQSREKFGDYQLVSEVAVNTIKRQERIFHSSAEISINVSPANNLYNDHSENGYHKVPHPIAKGMLGYRQLLVTKDRVDEFRKLKTLTDLKHYSIGQVSDWADVEVLQSNGIEVYAVPKYELLFPMLASKRFDSISVGCTEVQALTKFLEQNYPGKFAFVPDLVVFYPFSLFVFLNRDEKNALERLSYGYEVAYKKGDIDKLFDQYHGAVFKKLKTPGITIIQLKNLHLSAEGADTKPKLLE